MLDFLNFLIENDSTLKAAIASVIVAFGYAMVTYLNNSNKVKRKTRRFKGGALTNNIRVIEEFYGNYNNKSQDDVLKRLVEIEKKLEAIEDYNIDFQDDEKSTVIEDIKKSIITQSSDLILKELINKVETSTLESIYRIDIEQSINRLGAEKNSLFIRGNFNLVIGVIMSSVGGYIAYIFIERLPVSNSSVELISYSLPRFSLSILIGLLVFFFLNLYRKSLDDIKYYQNEITNLEAKYLALRLANQMRNHKTIGMVIESLIKTERNFILEKDQSTIELEKERINSNSTNSVIDMLKEVISSKK